MVASDELERGRRSYAERTWLIAFESLARADEAAPLEAEDLELLATSAYMLGRDDEWMRILERAHYAYVDVDDVPRAVRCAFWVGINLALREEVGRSTGWLSRAQRLIERVDPDCVERGYLLLPVVFEHEALGNYEAASATAGEAAKIGERFDDADLFALAVHQQGHVLIRDGRVKEGLGLLDEAMVAVTGGVLSPIVTGLVYCGVITGCQQVYELRRAREWTAALTRWCEPQSDLVAFTGRCLVHRAEILQLNGAWGEALEEAKLAGERCAQAMNEAAAAEAFYRQGEIHRLQGELDVAELAYRDASRLGWEPQPGLALLRLAQGNQEAASAALGRLLGETPDRLRRASLLAAYVEILLAGDEAGEARTASLRLEEIARDYESAVLSAMAAQARGAVSLAQGDARAALVALRRAWQGWQELEAPYEAARVRVLVGLGCRALGDEDSAALELDAARGVFAQLRAGTDLARVESLVGQATPRDAHGLTPRELEILRLVATGGSNREIATTLVISEHTVARHLQNIFAKLGVSSRTGASAFAYEHDLV